MSFDNKVCVVVPVHNRLELTKKFIENFSQNSYTNYKIVIVDDGSTDGTEIELKKEFPNIIILKGNGELWWSGSTNLGVKYAIDNDFDFVLTINNDSTSDKNLLKNLIKAEESHKDSIIGAKVMIGSTNKIWATGVRVSFYTVPFLHLVNCNFDSSDINISENLLETMALAGNGVLVPISVFKRIGLYDSNWCPQYHGDTEFTYRARKNNIKSYVAMDALVYNNEFVASPKFSFYNELFSKKSPHYWRPIVRFYWSHAPWRHKIFFFKQFLWIPKRIIKTIIGG
jgi:GT2 family glycosyltransferase